MVMTSAELDLLMVNLSFAKKKMHLNCLLKPDVDWVLLEFAVVVVEASLDLNLVFAAAAVLHLNNKHNNKKKAEHFFIIIVF